MMRCATLILMMRRVHLHLVMRSQNSLKMSTHIFFMSFECIGITVFSWLVVQQIKLTSVSFSAPESEFSFDYPRCFGCEVLFDQPHNSVSFDHDNLVLPIVRSQLAFMDGDYTDNFSDWFVVPGNDQSIASQVEQILFELRDDGMFSPSIEFVSEVMMMGRRTLSRKLAKERTSFQKIKTKIRRDLAKKVPINQ